MSKTIAAAVLSIPITLDIPLDRVLDLLIHGLDDGHSWMTWEKVNYPEGTTRADFEEGGKLRPDWVPDYVAAPYLAPFVGGSIVIADQEDDGKEYTIDRAAIETGLKVMAALKKNEGGHHFSNFRNEDEDAETGYVYLQCVCLPDVIKDHRLRYG